MTQRQVHPLIRHLPTIVAYAIAIGIGLFLLISWLDDDSDPDSTLSEFDARYLAKSAYSRMEQNTVSSAVCDALRYREDDDTWEIECRFDDDEEREITVWEVAANGQVDLIETRREEL